MTKILLPFWNQRKQELSGVYGEGNIFTAVINQETTKTNIESDYKVNWSSGDQISINGAVYSATPDESDATKAVFTYVSGTLPEASYYAIYPASLWSGEGVVFPATQTYNSGQFINRCIDSLISQTYTNIEINTMSFGGIKGDRLIIMTRCQKREPQCGLTLANQHNG